MEMNSDFSSPVESTSAFRRSYRWMHLCWGELDLKLSLRSTDGIVVNKNPVGDLRWAHAFHASRILGDSELLVVEVPVGPFQAIPWPHRNPLRNLLNAHYAFRFALVYLKLYLFLKRAGIPIVIFDLQDSAGLTARFLPLLRLSKRLYKRELPRFVANVFIHTERFAIEPWRNRGRYAAELGKVFPLSLAAGFQALPSQAHEKNIDILWAGSIENSVVRTKGVEQLRLLKAEGYKVELIEQRITKEEFLDKLSRSLISFCPDGNGWQCWRTFESACLSSVPLMTYPSVWQDVPFTHGVNCLYYDPEGDGLANTIRRALADRKSLVELGRRASMFVSEHHHEAAVYHRHIRAILE